MSRPTPGRLGEGLGPVVTRRVDRAVARWSLTPSGPLLAGLASWRLEVRTPDGAPAILKVARWARTGARERATLARLGDAAVRVLAADPPGAAMLLERVEPGVPLVRILLAEAEAEAGAGIDDADDRATLAAADVIADLRAASSEVRSAAGVADPPDLGPLPDLARSLPAWLGAARRVAVEAVVGAGRLADARAVARELLDSSPPAVVLHGDLHHDNLLSARRRRFVAIDPHGGVGDPGWELACLLRNPVEHAASPVGPVARLARRAAVLAERLGDPADRILAWAFVGAVVSAGWSASALEPVEAWLAVADAARATVLRPRAGSRAAAPR